jgi:hypothetical protein
MRKTVAAVYAALILTLLAVPARADCRRAVCAPHVVTYTPYVPPVYHETEVVAVPVVIIPSTFHQVAPEVVTARLIAIASDDAARRAVAEFAARYGIQVQPGGPPVGPPPLPPQPPAPPTPDPPVPPLAAKQGAVAPIPAAKGANPNGGPLATAQGMAGESCQKCHKPGSERMQLDFARLTRPQLLEVKHRLTTDNPKVAMPPPGDGRKPVSQEQLDAVDAILNAAAN